VPIYQALVLGAVQGATEFLPISSSGHLVIVPFLAGWKQPSVAFDVAVHVGTLLSVIWVFRFKIASLLRALFNWSTTPEADRRVLRLVVLGTIPAIVIGAILSDRVESVFERPVVVSLLLSVNGWAMLTAERIREHRIQRTSQERELEQLGGTDAVAVGVAQAIAILPGISRSGSTIGAGISGGLDRSAAADYSFLLAIPIIAGAAAVKVPDLSGEGAGVVLAGIVVAAVTGVIALRAFLGFVKRYGLKPFAAYCFLATLAGLLGALARG
jgi:undecaprenyl-diphosphatase